MKPKRQDRRPRGSSYLGQASQMANHASTRTTQLYDRRAEEVTLDEVDASVPHTARPKDFGNAS